MPKVVHFDLPVDDTKRAKKFYHNVFGWEFEKYPQGDQDYWMIKAGPDDEPGINGGMMKRASSLTEKADTIAVASVDQYLKRVLENGGEILSGKMSIKGIGYLAYFRDTENNIFALMEEDPEAK